jgi:arginine decarboxylase
MRLVEAEFGDDDWWFKVWGPDDLGEDGIGDAKNWVLKRTDEDGVQASDGQDAWHGFGDMAPGFNMLDPIKATIITPGLNLDGRFDTSGIPASIVTKYLAEHGVVVEKTGLYSFFIMFTIGITKGRWNTLLAAMQQFKEDHRKNQPMWRSMPEFCAKHPRYEHMGLRDLCEHVHALYSKYDVAILSTDMYLSDLTPAMTPTDAFSHIAQRTTQRVPIDDLEGRITTSLVTPYPPGIPLLIPGEVFNSKIVEYLKFNREFARECPGFETDIHGLVQLTGADGTIAYFADCVAE